MKGEDFKKLRISKGFKKRPALAAFLGCSADAIKKWERGERKVNRMAVKRLRSI